MLKSELLKMFAASLAFMLLILLMSFALFTMNFSPTYVEQDELNKNAAFSLKPGDALEYEIMHGNEAYSASFVFGKKLESIINSKITYANCTLATVAGTNISVCINKDGTLDEGNAFQDRFFFFSEWMLAIGENFSWNSKTLNSISRAPIEEFSVEYAGKDELYGRGAHVFIIHDSGFFGNATKKAWIDLEKRIVLKEEWENYTVEIIRAPFPLQQQGK